MKVRFKHLIGLLLLSLLALSISSQIDKANQEKQAQLAIDQNRSIVQTTAQYIELNNRKFAQDKISYLVQIENRGITGDLYPALLDGFMLRSSDPDLSNALRTIAEKIRPEVNVVPANLASEVICAAAIGAVLGREPKSIELDKVESDAVYVSYIRESDRKRWRQKCRIIANQVEWGDAQGRWQNTAMDSKIVFSWNREGIQVTQIHPDQSKTLSTWTWARLP